MYASRAKVKEKKKGNVRHYRQAKIKASVSTVKYRRTKKLQMVMTAKQKIASAHEVLRRRRSTRLR